MPELPEVETIVRYLSPVVTGQRPVCLQVHDPLIDCPQPDWLPESFIHKMFRHGKQIAVEFAAGGGETLGWLCIHLRMTGRLFWQQGETRIEHDRPPRAVLITHNGKLLFYDTRRLGTMTVCATADGLPETGIDPLSPDFTPSTLGALLSGRGQPVKPFLLRQDLVAGIGNIYASEILFQARIAPDLPAGQLSSTETANLFASIQDVLRRAIECCGSTISSFQFARNETGRFQECLNVYGRDGSPCRDCGAVIVRTVQQGRSTFFCPVCQPARVF